MPDLTHLFVADPAPLWAELGFHADDDGLHIGSVAVVLDQPGRGLTGWAFDALAADQVTLDGVAVTAMDGPVSPSVPARLPHPNGVVAIDHVVMVTPDLPRSVEALTEAGFELRRVRDIGRDDRGGARQQAFFWMGTVILEVVGPADAAGDGPATLWGLALTADLGVLGATLGDRLRPPKPAVQPGREIATLDRAAGSTVALAFMSSHRAPA